MTKIRDLHRKWMGDAEYRREHEALEEEFALASAMIEARKGAGLTQEELGKRDGYLAECHRPHGDRARYSVRQYAQAFRARDRHTFAHHVRAGETVKASLSGQ